MPELESELGPLLLVLSSDPRRNIEKLTTSGESNGKPARSGGPLSSAVLGHAARLSPLPLSASQHISALLLSHDSSSHETATFQTLHCEHSSFFPGNIS